MKVLQQNSSFGKTNAERKYCKDMAKFVHLVQTGPLNQYVNCPDHDLQHNQKTLSYLKAK